MTSGPAPTEPDQLARIWSGYAHKGYGSYSPLNSVLAKAVSGSAELLDFVRSQPAHAHDPNMLLAAVHYLVLGGVEHPLERLYEPDAALEDEDAVAALLESFCREHCVDLVGILAVRRIQTNEVGRTGGLALGLACAARLVGEPLALVDAGASAGLNLLLDEYHLRYRPNASIGPSDSPVQIDCRVEPADLPLPLRVPALRGRVGLDRDPVDVTVPENARWLLACIWPGTGRQERAEAAMRLLARRPPLVRNGDMVSDLGDTIAGLRPGPVAVVTSWSFSYLREGDRRAFESALTDLSGSGPIAWVCCDSPGVSKLFEPSEPPPDDGDISSILGLAVFDSGRVGSRCLGYMHPHGQWVRWLDPSMTPSFP